MTATVNLRNIAVDFPIYQGSSRSLKQSLAWRGTGGTLAGNAGRRISVKALQDISFDLGEGDRVALVGHNGAGKTTLMRVVAGVYEPSSGRIRVSGSICPVFDVRFGLDPDATGHENIVLRSLLLGMNNDEIRANAEEVGAFTELGPYLHMPLRTYSAGMLLRLAFGISTSVRPQILLLDEGVLAWDSHFLGKAQKRLANFVDRSQILVLASHNTELLRTWCTLGMYLEAGRLKLFGPLETVLAAYEADVAGRGDGLKSSATT